MRKHDRHAVQRTHQVNRASGEVLALTFSKELDLQASLLMAVRLMPASHSVDFRTQDQQLKRNNKLEASAFAFIQNASWVRHCCSIDASLQLLGVAGGSLNMRQDKLSGCSKYH
ncbi:hypothetical protein RRG08_012829 [Elysia crispata]|uniref:Uncharacterized protein n=1 Tax=Elysia crispata TaxID=231223 RepID=A0AAE1CPV3_9GAST|nr:hypothetical protein RRG08_012829 [Elysia crispata]